MDATFAPLKQAARFLCVAAVLSLFILNSNPSSSASCVDVALVLAVDGSQSINDVEFETQRGGIAAALRDPDVLHAMLSTGVVSVAVLFWGDAAQPPHKIDWVTIRDARDAEDLAKTIAKSQRRVSGLTGLGAGLSAALTLFDSLGSCARRSIVNVSADGQQSIVTRRFGGPQPQLAKKRAMDAGITINALIMNSEETGIVAYYAQHVVTEPDGFLIEVEDHASFAKALKLKLLREIGLIGVVSLD